MARRFLVFFMLSFPVTLCAQRQRLTNQPNQQVQTACEVRQDIQQQKSEKREKKAQNEADSKRLGLEQESTSISALAHWPGLHEYMRCFIVDTFDIWKSLFSRQSMYVLSAIIPTYLATRQANYVIHKHFYYGPGHQNIKQPSAFLSEIAIANGLVAIPFVALNMYGFLSRKDPLEFRRVQVFNAGLIATLVAKLILKECKHHDSYRPWHQDFSCEHQADNGWPSGHSAMLAYLATFWGLEKGYEWGLPFGVFTLYAMAINVVTNHHYLSQTFVGAGLGVLFGVAGHKTMHHITHHESFYVGLGTSYQGKPAVRVAYDF